MSASSLLFGGTRRVNIAFTFFLTSFFNDSIHSTSDRTSLLISIYDGRENRNHGNQEKGKEKRKEKEVVIARQPSGEAKASPNVFCGADFFLIQPCPRAP